MTGPDGEMAAGKETRKPLVSVMLPTYNRREYLPASLGSVLRQEYENLEIFVIRDGGDDVSDIVHEAGDERIRFIDRRENRGKPRSLNEALASAGGKYVCYLDDDDIWYPNHVSTLVNTLEENPRFGAAYSDLYKTTCRTEPDGSRVVLSKVLEVSRDFDRFLTLCYSHILHVSLMHRRDLLEKTGPFNEDLNILIDWDIIRKLSFFTDFIHVYTITGEWFAPVGDSDRISVVWRKKIQDYRKNILRIRTARPPKPWPKIKDLSIILLSPEPSDATVKTISSIIKNTYYPYLIYLPMSARQKEQFATDVPNIVSVEVPENASPRQRIGTTIAQSEGDYTAVVPEDFEVGTFWIEDCLHAFVQGTAEGQVLELEASREFSWAAVMEKWLLIDIMRYYRQNLRQAVDDAGVKVRRLRPEEIPFQCDQLLSEAKKYQEKGNWLNAAEVYEYMADSYGNTLWFNTLAANAYYRGGNYDRSDSLITEINKTRPTVETLLLDARIKREKKDIDTAAGLLSRAEQILEGNYYANEPGTYL